MASDNLLLDLPAEVHFTLFDHITLSKPDQLIDLTKYEDPDMLQECDSLH